MVAVLCVLCFWGSVARAGSIEGWGLNNDGLCDQIPTDTDFVAVAAGASHAIALKSNGTVVAWGSNAFGQTDVPDSNDIVAIAAGDHFSIALREGGSLLAWGIEDGSTNDRGQVTDLPEGSDFIAIAAGHWHGLAIRDDGSAVAWGRNDIGQSSVPTGNDFMAIGGGAFHSAAVRGDGITGSIDPWGTTSWGLSNVPQGSDFIAVDGGYYHGLALRADGTLAAWGVVTNEQVADTPSDNGYAAIAAGHDFNVALKADGSLAAWGKNDDGQTDVPEGNSFIAVAAGAATGFAISEPGSLTLTSPNGGEVLKTATMHTITWEMEGNITNVWIEYSTDNGAGWNPVAPPNQGNTGSYEWLVPVATSQECLVRVRTSLAMQIADHSDAPFTVYVCPLSGDVTGDCVVDLADLAVIASQWLQSYDSYAG